MARHMSEVSMDDDWNFWRHVEHAQRQSPLDFWQSRTWICCFCLHVHRWRMSCCRECACTNEMLTEAEWKLFVFMPCDVTMCRDTVCHDVPATLITRVLTFSWVCISFSFTTFVCCFKLTFVLFKELKKKIWNSVDCQRSEKRSKTHKRLKERFWIWRNRTKHAKKVWNPDFSTFCPVLSS